MSGSTKPQVDADAIVIGAGAAGLAAARKLAEGSRRVVVLEARDRIGGRAWTRLLEHSATPAELGAEFIHGPAEQTRRLLRETGIRDEPMRGDSWVCDVTGRLRRDDRDFSSTARILERARSLAVDESADRFLRRMAAEEATREAAETARTFVEGFEAADPAIASVQSIANELRSGVDSQSARPVGGYGPMFDHLRETCIAAGVQIRLAAIVRRVRWQRGRVTIDARISGGGSTELRARTAIVTLPIGVLQHHADGTEIAFDPQLPPTKVEALRYLKMGSAVKVVLSFRSAFWERICDEQYRDAGFFRCRDQAFIGYWTQLPQRSTMIVAWAGGPKAEVLSGVSDTELVKRALTNFGALFDEPDLARDEFEGGAVHNWDHDPLARGAYSYVLVGGGSARAALAAPVENTLFFAGEATSADGQGGTVNGALETGERAAAEVARSMIGAD